MKTFHHILLAVLALGAGLTACSDDDTIGRGGTHNVGEAVKFGVSSFDTRTAYGTGDGADQWQIYWSFNTADPDYVRIFSQDAYVGTAPVEGQTSQCAYTVQPENTAANEVVGAKGKLTPVTDGTQLLWGKGKGEKGENTFYAAYPGNLTTISVPTFDTKGTTNASSSWAVFSFPINHNQKGTLTSTGSGSSKAYVVTPDMENQYMVARATANRKASESVDFHFMPIMTTLEVTLSRDASAGTEQECMVDGISVISQMPADLADADCFYYRVGSFTKKGDDVSYGSNNYLCDKQGNDISATTDLASVTTTITFTGDDNHIELEAGQSVTLTVFLPPYAIQSGTAKIRVSGSGTSTVIATLNTAVEPSAKLKVKLPAIKDAEVVDNLWMTPLDPRIYVSQLSVPGTHDAATKDVSTGGDTQSLTIAEQLSRGIRFFDLRPSGRGSDLPIYHGTLSTGVSLKEAFEAFNTFLDNHNQEFIFVLMRWEDENGLFSSNTEDNFNKYMKAFVQTDTYLSHALPREFCKKDVTVGEMRGKILTIMRPNQGSSPDWYFTGQDESAEAPAGMMFISGFPGGNNYNQTGYLKTHYVDYSSVGQQASSVRTDWQVWAQNFYEIKSDDEVSQKNEIIKTYLGYSKQQAENLQHVWVINHTSGYYKTNYLAVGRWYPDLARKVNHNVYNYLMSDEWGGGCAGFILMDYAYKRYYSYMLESLTVDGHLLPSAIINNNYKYYLKRRAR